jgi:hypothetical protein
MGYSPFNGFLSSRSGQISGYEVLYVADWNAVGNTSTPHAPSDNARDTMDDYAKAIGANAIVYQTYTKGTGSKGNYRFTTHHLRGRPAIIARLGGSYKKEDFFVNLSENASIYQDNLDQARRKANNRGISMMAIAFSVAFIAVNFYFGWAMLWSVVLSMVAGIIAWGLFGGINTVAFERV